MPVYLGTNSAQMNLDWVRTLNAGDDDEWSQRLRFFLQNIDTDYVLLLLEDFFFDRLVSSQELNVQLGLLHTLQGISLRLFPNPPANYFHNGLGVLSAGAHYRVSLQASIWNRGHLLDLLVDEETPWEFEWHGSQRSRSLSSGFYCVSKAVLHYWHVVERGEWFLPAARFYATQNIGCDFGARPVMGALKTRKKAFANFARRTLNRAHSYWLHFSGSEKMADGV